MDIDGSFFVMKKRLVTSVAKSNYYNQFLIHFYSIYDLKKHNTNVS